MGTRYLYDSVRSKLSLRFCLLLESGFVSRPIESGAIKYAEWLSESSWGLLGVKSKPFNERIINGVNKQAYPPPTVKGVVPALQSQCRRGIIGFKPPWYYKGFQKSQKRAGRWWTQNKKKQGLFEGHGP